MTTITKASAPQRATALGARQFKFVISTADLDRTGDRIEPRGWQLDDYRRNPVVLFGHRHDVPAIAKASYIAVEGPQLVATATFPPEGLHPLADTVHGLLREGFLTSASVGFQPIQGSPNRDGGTDWSAQILREWSIVNVPALGQAEIARCAATVDRGAVTKWLGADAEPVLMIEDDADEPGVVKPGALLAAAVRTVMARQSRSCSAEATSRSSSCSRTTSLPRRRRSSSTLRPSAPPCKSTSAAGRPAGRTRHRPFARAGRLNYAPRGQRGDGSQLPRAPRGGPPAPGAATRNASECRRVRRALPAILEQVRTLRAALKLSRTREGGPDDVD